MAQAAVRAVSGNRIPPHDLDAEQSVLGAMLESREAIGNCLEILDADDFYKPAHTEIYETILELNARAEAVDAITVADELNRRDSLEQIGGRPYIMGLLQAYPTASAAAHYARIVEEHAILRRLIEAGNKVQEIGFSMPEDVDDAVNAAEELVYEVGDRRLKSEVAMVKPLLGDVMNKIELLYERGDSITGLASGFGDLDEMTTGFQPSNLIIVAARPAMGKSSLLGDFALSAALKQSQPVIIFSLEMGREEVVQRFLSSESRVDSQKLRRGSLNDQDWPRLSAALGRLAEAPIFIDDSASISLTEIRAKSRRIQARYGLGLVIVDYLQLMHGPRRSENRQQEVSEISRALKIMARELNVPVMCASQLNRAVEARGDKRPLLGDLRESGCLTGDSLVTLADGRRERIDALVGTTPNVATLDGWQVGSRLASRVWRTGTRPVLKMTLASGRTIRATDNHPFRVFNGWKALGDLKINDRVGIPRVTKAVSSSLWPKERLILLAHLIGDGSFLKGQPLRYASTDESNIDAVVQAAGHFGVTARVKFEEAARSYQVFLPSPHRCTHSVRNPINAWLDDLGLFDKRSHQKFIPEDVQSLPNAQIALFLRHLWATDGCAFVSASDPRRTRVYYATNCYRLACGVQALLCRLDIRTFVRKVEKRGYRPGYHVIVSGMTEELAFANRVGGHGPRSDAIEKLIEMHRGRIANPNSDTIPLDVWNLVRMKMKQVGISQRQMAELRGSTYGGTSHFRFSPSRTLLSRYAEILEDVELKEIASSDIYWDRIVSIEPDGVENVFDMTVPGTHNFVANGVFCHNSIEQDADIVMLLYRDEVYNPDTEAKGEAEIIIAKHRNGPTGTVHLAFLNQYTKFASIAKAPGL